MKIVRVFGDSSGETHLEDVELEMTATQMMEGIPPIMMTAPMSTHGVTFSEMPAELLGMSQEEHEAHVGWHAAPAPMYVVVLQGDLEIQTSDGDSRRLQPGAVIRAEDMGTKGHLSLNQSGTQHLLYVPIVEP